MLSSSRSSCALHALVYLGLAAHHWHDVPVLVAYAVLALEALAMCRAERLADHPPTDEQDRV